MTTTTPARVVVVDDSALMRNIVTRSLTRAGIEVVGSAGDGDEALALCARERPDAMTLDLTMPGLDGLGVLRALRERSDSNIPVVVVSAFSAAHGARAVDALAEGAFDLVSKPTATESLETFIENLGAKVKLAAASRRTRRSAHNGDGHAPIRPAAAPVHSGARFTARRHQTAARTAKLVMIATSTGGPRALASLVPDLPAPLGAGTLIVQHMPAGFTGSLAARLDASSALCVREATGGEALDAGTALLAPGGRHLRLAPDGRTTLTDEPAVGGLRPRADLLIEDAARVYGERMVLVVLTGMGSDGLSGAREVHRRGGRILVESEESCTVFGMPRAIVDAGLADDVLDLGTLAEAIANEAGA
ncbi:MAG TPA: chemotaxis-specific protein-glutamate methyltransferase CheB [Solirubrobacteraceae bacterium]|jgi:two-component system chemotaxis response regulator CheB|nr:chemotaxis-specific protein-glutamate methyltransferase CheB [Solirubrobacteraceae bacterium]